MDWVVVVAILGAVPTEVIREQGHTNGDVALALLYGGPPGGGVTGLAGEGAAASLQVYLFGSVTSISPSDGFGTPPGWPRSS